MNAITVSAIVTACATLVYCIIAGFLWYETRRSTRATQYSFDSANTPHLSIAELSVRSDQGQAIIRAVLKNSGNSPANDLEIQVRCTYLKKEKQIYFSHPSSIGTQSSKILIPYVGWTIPGSLFISGLGTSAWRAKCTSARKRITITSPKESLALSVRLFKTNR